MGWPAPVTLQGRHARLVPLSRTHLEGLCAAAADGELWRLWYTAVPPPERMAAEIERRLELQAAGSMLPFTVFAPGAGPGAAAGGSAGEPAAGSTSDNVSGRDIAPGDDRIVGMTTYMHIDAVNRRVEIGSTWTAASAQRTALNTQCKRLLLGHAFDTLDSIAVEFRTHRLNTQSRRAIERLGAQLDGVLRAHVRSPDGTLRDTAVYSITAADWPAVRSHLDWQLARPR